MLGPGPVPGPAPGLDMGLGMCLGLGLGSGLGLGLGFGVCIGLCLGLSLGMGQCLCLGDGPGIEEWFWGSSDGGSGRRSWEVIAIVVGGIAIYVRNLSIKFDNIYTQLHVRFFNVENLCAFDDNFCYFGSEVGIDLKKGPYAGARGRSGAPK